MPTGGGQLLGGDKKLHARLVLILCKQQASPKKKTCRLARLKISTLRHLLHAPSRVMQVRSQFPREFANLPGIACCLRTQQVVGHGHGNACQTFPGGCVARIVHYGLTRRSRIRIQIGFYGARRIKRRT